MVAWIREHGAANVIGYCILAFAIIAASFVFQQQQNRQNSFADALARQQARSCGALLGASEYWRLTLAAINLSLQDDTLVGIAREARLKQKDALTNVIDKARRASVGC